MNQQNIIKGEIATAKVVGDGGSIVNPFAGRSAVHVKSGTLEPVKPSNNARELAKKYDEEPQQALTIEPQPLPVLPEIVPNNDEQIRLLQEQIAKLSTPVISSPSQSFESTEIQPLTDLDVPEVVQLPKENPIQEFRTPTGLPSYRCEFEGRDIMVGFPCYKTTNPVTAFALLALALDFGRDKIRFEMNIGDAMIYHSRNAIAHRFLETDAKWLLQIDDDIIPCIGRPGWMRTWVKATIDTPDLPLQRHVLHRLIGAKKSLVGASYFGRQDGAPLIASDPDGRLAKKARAYSDEIVPVEWVGTGCLLTHRSVFESIKKSFPEISPKRQGGHFNFYQPLDAEHGEDVSFCLRARKAGHQPYLDLGTPVFHLGFKTY